MTLQEIFAGCTAKPLLAEEPMAKHTSFRIGGPADLMAMPQSEQELQQLLQRACEAKVPVTLIGNGSNLLVRDKGIRGLETRMIIGHDPVAVLTRLDVPVVFHAEFLQLAAFAGKRFNDADAGQIVFDPGVDIAHPFFILLEGFAHFLIKVQGEDKHDRQD